MAENKQQIETLDEKIQTFSIERVCKSSNFLKNLREIIDSHPDESAKNLGMSIMHLLNDDYGKMLECLKLLVQNHPDVPLIHRRIAEIYINQDDYETAVPHLEKALKLDKEDLTTKIWLGLSYFATGNEKKAKVCLGLLKGDVFLLHAANSNWFEQET